MDLCSRQGLIDEFNIQAPFSPPGFDEAKPGESFLKIGVGELVRHDKDIYKFFRCYATRKIAPVSCYHWSLQLGIFIMNILHIILYFIMGVCPLIFRKR